MSRNPDPYWAYPMCFGFSLVFILLLLLDN